MSNMLDHALQYASQGVEVLACWGIGPDGTCGCGNRGCRSPGKHPVTVRGVHDATTDATVIREWFSGPVEFNVAARTGKLVVLDEDRCGALLGLGIEELPNCPCAITGRGRHFFFTSNGTAIASRSAIVPGLDIRALDSYVILPPSKHASGAVYKWATGHAFSDLALPNLPDELARLLMPLGPSGAGVNDHQDLFGRLRVESLLEEIAALPADAGGRWRELVLRLVGSLIARGLSDDVITMITRRATRVDLGYTHEATDELVTGLIRSTRRRWGRPEPAEATFDQVDGEPAPVAPLRVVSATEFLTLKLPPRESILGPWLTSKSLSMLYGPRGEGKTYLVLGIAIAVATGTKFLGWEAPRPRRVLLIDGEMPAEVMQERIRKLAGGADLENLTVIAADLQDQPMPNLATEDGQAAVAEPVEQADLVIIDNLASLARSGDENERQPWLVIAVSIFP